MDTTSIPPPSSVVASLLSVLGIPRLEPHLARLGICIALFQLAFVVATGPLARYFLPPRTQAKQRCVWALHVVSSIHCIYALHTAFRHATTLAAAPVFGHDDAVERALIISVAYFLWDAVASIRFSGAGFALHGVVCAIVFLSSFQPFLMHFAVAFLAYELSTPFLNLHWFMEKNPRWNGSMPHAINGVLLLATFAYGRLYRGYYMSWDSFVAIRAEWDTVPVYLAVIIGTANIILNLLNVYWFAKMCNLAHRRIKATQLQTKAKTNKSE